MGKQHSQESGTVVKPGSGIHTTQGHTPSPTVGTSRTSKKDCEAKFDSNNFLGKKKMKTVHIYIEKNESCFA